MGETDLHISLIIYLREALRDHFRADPNIYVAGNMFFYYEEGDPASVVAPDVFVVRGVTKGQRRTYKLWDETKAPSVVFEVTSRSTRLEDLGNKRALYALLGVPEYYLFDPEGDYLEPRLWAYHLNTDQNPGEYERVFGDVIYSPLLGLELLVEDSLLRLRNPSSGENLLTPQEAHAARRAETEARRAEAEARQAAEAEAAHLRAELERLKTKK